MEGRDEQSDEMSDTGGEPADKRIRRFSSSLASCEKLQLQQGQGQGQGQGQEKQSDGSSRYNSCCLPSREELATELHSLVAAHYSTLPLLHTSTLTQRVVRYVAWSEHSEAGCRSLCRFTGT